MSGLFAFLETGWLAFAALAFLWLETGLLCALSRQPWTRFKALAGGAFAGTFLLAALGLALRGDALVWILLLLTLSLVSHVFDVSTRLRDHAARFRRSTDRLSTPATLTQRK